MKTLIPFFLFLSGLSYGSESLKVDTSGCRRRVINNAFHADKSSSSVILSHDRAENLVYEPSKFVKNVNHMESLKTGETKAKPWSDSYWPLYKGGLGQRYKKDEFFNFNWQEAYDFVSQNPVSEMIKNGEFKYLSPSEKYDVIMGLTEMPLTASSWQDGKAYFDQYGTVETWMGLCHGWAAASIMVPEPKKKVSIETTSGKAIFYPSDIKAFNSLLWAKGNFRTRFIGGRCNSKKPGEDRSGRTTDEECLDNNPGTFHLVVVNQIGLSKKPFIMDASYDYEVWNHPVFSYEYSWFNPKTKKFEDTLAKSIEPTGSWDKKRKYRAKEARFIVGVEMAVSYSVENQPSHEENQETEISQMQLSYDLELDENYNIVGGEWHNNTHPDFLWVPEPGSYPATYGHASSEINFLNLSQSEKSYARQNAKLGLPWGPVVKQLTSQSSR